MIVRLARMDDVEGLRTLYTGLAEGRDDALPGDANTTAHVLAAITAQPDRYLLVAEVDGGQIAGTVDVLIVNNLTHGGQPWAIVENLAVAESHRRHGIGRALMQDAISRARAANCYKLQLISGKQRGPAHSFYRALGLEAAAEGFKVYLS